MNKRIKLFAELTGGEFYTGFAGSPNSVKFMEQDLEKFVGLIVQECVWQVVKDKQVPHDLQVLISERITECFGDGK